MINVNTLATEFVNGSEFAMTDLVNHFKTLYLNGYLFNNAKIDAHDIESEFVEAIWYAAQKWTGEGDFTNMVKFYVSRRLQNAIKATKTNTASFYNKAVRGDASMDDNGTTIFSTVAEKVEENVAFDVTSDLLDLLYKVSPAGARVADLLKMVYLEGKSYKEVAMVLGITANSMKMTHKRSVEFAKKVAVANGLNY